MVLAGGLGSRLGGDKLSRSYHGRPLLHHALEAAAAIVPTVVLAGPFDGRLPPLPDGARLGAALIQARDARPGQGPLAGVVAGLAAAGETQPDYGLVLAGDQPDLLPALLQGLLATVSAEAVTRALVLGDAAGWQPMPCLVQVEPALVAARERLAAGHGSLRGWLDRLAPLVVPEDDWRAWDPKGLWRHDVDTPEDLARG